jgi:hypothetical protein
MKEDRPKKEGYVLYDSIIIKYRLGKSMETENRLVAKSWEGVVAKQEVMANGYGFPLGR